MIGRDLREVCSVKEARVSFCRAFQRRCERPIAVERLALVLDCPTRLGPKAKVQRVEKEEIIDRASCAIEKMILEIPRWRLGAFFSKFISRPLDGVEVYLDMTRLLEDKCRGL